MNMLGDTTSQAGNMMTKDFWLDAFEVAGMSAHRIATNIFMHFTDDMLNIPNNKASKPSWTFWLPTPGGSISVPEFKVRVPKVEVFDLPVDVVSGRNRQHKWGGRVWGIGMLKNWSTTAYKNQRNHLLLFRVDWHDAHHEREGENRWDYDFWPIKGPRTSHVFHIHVPKPYE